MQFRPETLRQRAAWVICFLFALVFCFAGESLAQQPTGSAPDQSDSTAPAKRPNPASPVALFNTLNRKSLVFPDIATSVEPLSTGGKFQLFVNNSISLSTLFVSAAGAAISQGTDSPDGYRQGSDGFAKRFGANMARNASSNFFGTFLLASALHQDPRFFPERNPSFGGSIKYSARRLFITRKDSGEETANWSGLIGPLLAEGLANTYYPQQNRSAGETLERFGWDMAAQFGGNMFRNYWPVFFKRLGGTPVPRDTDRAK